MDEMATESQIIVLLRGLEGLANAYRRPLADIERQTREVLHQLKTVDLGRLLNADLCYRVEQWEGEELQRVVAACALLDVAIEGWKIAAMRDPKSTWLLRQGAQVLKSRVPPNVPLK